MPFNMVPTDGQSFTVITFSAETSNQTNKLVHYTKEKEAILVSGMTVVNLSLLRIIQTMTSSIITTKDFESTHNPSEVLKPIDNLERRKYNLPLESIII